MLALSSVLLCLGVFLSWRATGSEISAALVVAGAVHAEHVANGGVPGHSIDENHLLAEIADENEARDVLPSNAALLIMLALGAFFGPALGWLPASGRARPRSRGPLLIKCWFHSIVHIYQGRPFATLLGVFRL